MDVFPNDELTTTLLAAVAGEEGAADRLFPLVYDQLRRIAHWRLAQLPPGQTLQATALVHEAYLQVARGDDRSWEGQTHFFNAASRAMRCVLIDALRRKSSLKRGGDRQRIELEESRIAEDTPSWDLEAVDRALARLEEKNPDGAQLVLLRYFSGLTIEETAERLGISTSTLERKWRFLRAWLQEEIHRDSES